MLVAGVNGCKNAWLVLTASGGPKLTLQDTRVIQSFAEVVEFTRACDTVGVDIPIGLAVDGPREADREARALIGPRRSSVFPAPVQAVLQAMSFLDASDISAASRTDGKRISQQTFAILPKIREVSLLMTPLMQERIVEGHPEVSFWALNNGRPLLHHKRGQAGQDERRRLLKVIFGDGIAFERPPQGAKLDDLYDACALAWSASRRTLGQESRVPATAQRNIGGLRMEIIY
jgi:predicted RNase H-like nuclease